nr:hypothetical protein [uncultured Treponema sp.]
MGSIGMKNMKELTLTKKVHQKIRVVPIPDNIAPTLRREVEGETVRKIAGHNSLAMTDYYTRAAIQEMVEAVKPAVGAANRLFE